MTGWLAASPLFGLVLAVLLGTLIGSFTGLVPGVHVNTVAPIVLALALAGGATEGALWAALLIFSVAIVHTIINVIPTLAAPLPEDDTALILLPVQRMAQSGHATAALAISILASWTAALIAVLMLIAVLLVFPHQLAHVPRALTLLAVTGILVLLLTRQSRPWKATAVLLLSGTAGFFLLERSFPGPLGGDGTVLLPVFAGLFGAPLLLITLFEPNPQAGEAAEEDEPSDKTHDEPRNKPAEPPRAGTAAMILGTGCGLLVALFPGLTSATAGAFGRALRPPRSDAEDVAMLSAVDTANVIGNTGALLVWGATRSGASAAAAVAHPTTSATGAGVTAAFALMSLLAATAIAGLAALRWGPRLVERLRQIPPRSLAGGALALLVAIVLLSGGPMGLLVTAFLIPLGLLPHHWGTPRALLMGFLLVPYLASSYSAGPVV